MGAEAVGQALAVILLWSGVIWLGVWFVRKIRTKILARSSQQRQFRPR